MTEKKKYGYVYVVANQSFPNEYKIGSSINYIERIQSLHTSTPKEFKLVVLFGCYEYKELEGILHRLFKDKQLKPRREFFRLTEKDFSKMLSMYSQHLVKFDKELLKHIKNNQDSPGETANEEQKEEKFFDDIGNIFSHIGEKLPYNYVKKGLIKKGYNMSEINVFLKRLDNNRKLLILEEDIKLLC